MRRLKGPIAISALVTICVLLGVKEVASRPPMHVVAIAKSTPRPAGAGVTSGIIAAAPGVAGPVPGLPFLPGWKECPILAKLQNCAGGGASLNNPICAVSEAGMLKTFSNQCLFDYHNCVSKGTWVVLHDGVC